MNARQALGLAAIAAALALAAPAAAEPLLLGVFAGTLPCADCSGIATELTLVRRDSGWAEGRYLLKQTYIGRAVAPRVTTGEWTTLRGDAADDNASVYELDPDSPDRAQHFLMDGPRRLRALDRDLKPWPKGLPSILIRRTRGLPTPAAVNCLRRGGLPAAAGACAKAPAG